MVLAHDTRGGEGGVRRTADIATEADVAFDSMLLAPRTLAGLTAAGFSRPSPVQLQGIPTGKCGFNLLLEAKSGTGKTAVFAVIALELLDGQEDAQVLILAPTREIAAQITDVIKQIGSQYKGLTVEVVMGGLPLQEDIQKFSKKRKVQVIVGSPGRLRHLIEKCYIDTTSVRLLVLDEADKLMQSCFRPDINYIFSSLPKHKQVIMSSATYPDDLRELINKYMSKYLHICPNSTSVLLGIEQKLTVVNQHSNIVTQTLNRYTELIKILKSRQFKQCLIFCNYQARVVEVCKKLTTDKWPVQLLHGQLDQTVRLDALKTLQEYKCRILVSTDLAARGIDASNVDLVVNFEVPYEWPTYLHRIGRAGRYGSYGLAITILAKGKEEIAFKELLKSLGGPVNMRELWTDEAVDLDRNNKNGDIEMENYTAIVNGLKKVNIMPASIKSKDKLWGVMIGDNEIKNQLKDQAQEIEDFEKLTVSYDNSEEIECFTDLLNSFENSNIKQSEIVFKTLNLNYEDIENDLKEKSQTQLDFSDEEVKDVNDVYENIHAKSNDNFASNSFSNSKKKNNTHHNTTKTIKTNFHSKNKQYSFSNSIYENTEKEQSSQDINDVDHSYYSQDGLHCYDTSIKNKKSRKTIDLENNSTNGNLCNEYNGGCNTYKNKTDYSFDSQDIYRSKIYSPKIHNNFLNTHKPESQPETSNHYRNIKNKINTHSKKDTHGCKQYPLNYKTSQKYQVESSTSESSASDTSSDSGPDSTENDSYEESDYENVRWSLTSEEGKKLYKKLGSHENVVRMASQITAAKHYHMWNKQLAVRRKQIQMAVYIQEMGKFNRI